jgi:hypothetical protein
MSSAATPGGSPQVWFDPQERCPSSDRPSAARRRPAVDFVVESMPQLGEVVRRVRDGRLRASIGNIAALDDAVAALSRPSDAGDVVRVRP